ncbi:hypothetical protein HAX54_009552 [Datura stramonium]|uniref:TF-B3 domain-containing protein n=1 Tax=Datura stramonium TaxID=4076 RepID=A0ABS8RZT7_DATST|nr:hypothetical protein [Datura stramonium]
MDQMTTKRLEDRKTKASQEIGFSEYISSGLLKEYANGSEKVIKSKPVGSKDTSSLNAVKYSCLVDVKSRDFLVLPESWRDLLKRSKLGRWIIFLRGPDQRIWPTFYHSKRGFDVLTSGWKEVTAAYGLNAGDDCLFELVNQQERKFDIHKIRKSASKNAKRTTWSQLPCVVTRGTEKELCQFLINGSLTTFNSCLAG